MTSYFDKFFDDLTEDELLDIAQKIDDDVCGIGDIDIVPDISSIEEVERLKLIISYLEEKVNFLYDGCSDEYLYPPFPNFESLDKNDDYYKYELYDIREKIKSAWLQNGNWSNTYHNYVPR